MEIRIGAKGGSVTGVVFDWTMEHVQISLGGVSSAGEGWVLWAGQLTTCCGCAQLLATAISAGLPELATHLLYVGSQGRMSAGRILQTSQAVERLCGTSVLHLAVQSGEPTMLDAVIGWAKQNGFCWKVRLLPRTPRSWRLRRSLSSDLSLTPPFLGINLSFLYIYLFSPCPFFLTSHRFLNVVTSSVSISGIIFS